MPLTPQGLTADQINKYRMDPLDAATILRLLGNKNWSYYGLERIQIRAAQIALLKNQGEAAAAAVALFNILSRLAPIAFTAPIGQGRVYPEGAFLPSATASSEGPRITVLGSLRDTKQFIGRPGFNVLNVPDEIFKAMSPEAFDQLNAQWLNMSLRRGDSIWLVTDPAAYTEALLTKYGTTGGSRYISLELPMLEHYGALAPESASTGQSAFLLFKP